MQLPDPSGALADVLARLGLKTSNDPSWARKLDSEKYYTLTLEPCFPAKSVSFCSLLRLRI